MKITEEQKTRKVKAKVITSKKPETETVLRAEFDGKLIALMKVKPPKKDS